MSEVTARFYKISKDGFLSKLNNFQSNVSRAFNTPINTFITDTVTSMKKIYSQVLEKFIAASYYHGDENDYEHIGSEMRIWRIPVGI